MTDFKNIKIGYLTGVKRLDYPIVGRKYWLWKCICGNLIEVPPYRKQSCGCKTYESQKIEGIRRKLPNNQSLKNRLFRNYKNGAIKRNYIFNLSKEEFESFLDKNCYYCGNPPSNECYVNKTKEIFLHNGIDRLDNSIGYIFNNCVSCCIICNRMKMNLDYKKFINQIVKIKNYHIENSNNS